MKNSLTLFTVLYFILFKSTGWYSTKYWCSVFTLHLNHTPMHNMKIVRTVFLQLIIIVCILNATKEKHWKACREREKQWKNMAQIQHLRCLRWKKNCVKSSMLLKNRSKRPSSAHHQVQKRAKQSSFRTHKFNDFSRDLLDCNAYFLVFPLNILTFFLS